MADNAITFPTQVIEPKREFKLKGQPAYLIYVPLPPYIDLRIMDIDTDTNKPLPTFMAVYKFKAQTSWGKSENQTFLYEFIGVKAGSE